MSKHVYYTTDFSTSGDENFTLEYFSYVLDERLSVMYVTGQWQAILGKHRLKLPPTATVNYLRLS